ncbi:MAG: hypothetical protein RJA70_1951 [Pseudomonadota bacterium]|jgi:uncharacterized membrane protein/fructose-specific component phosphotransferase system IIB-like protein
MTMKRWPAVLALLASGLGLLFGTNSTLDYAKHLDRSLHDVHCSFIPGAAPTADAEACRAAMYSPYSAILKESYWGGIPISLFSLGAFSFFAGVALYLVLAGPRASRGVQRTFGVLSLGPLLTSIVMFAISLIKLGALCNTCVGIYISSALLAIGGIAMLLRPNVDLANLSSGPTASPYAVAAVGLMALGVTTLVPGALYAAAMPDHSRFLGNCGTLKKPAVPELLTLKTSSPVKSAIMFEDPLCPTCKAFHQRLVIGELFEKLEPKLVLFPLDSACNWMLSEPLHPGACIVSKAVICGGAQAREVLEWAYDEQEALTAAGKAGDKQLTALIQTRFGAKMIACMGSAATKNTLNKHLHYAVDNSIAVSTPQLYLGDQRFCDEDSDIGLSYTMAKLAPEVVR